MTRKKAPPGSGTLGSPLAAGLASGEETNAKCQPGNSRSKQGKGISLRLVGDALTEAGLDPMTEIINALRGDKLDEKTKLLVSMELLQYTQPKLKAIEHKGKVDLSDEQVEARLEFLLSKAEGK